MRRLFWCGWGDAAAAIAPLADAGDATCSRCNLDAMKGTLRLLLDASAYRQGYTTSIFFHTVHLGRRDACATLHIAGTEGSRLCAPVCLFCSH
jgi:hypothetical protein